MIENGDIKEDQTKIGYVGAYPYAEVKSGYTAFFLGVRSVCPSATMKVIYTNSWASIDLEKEAAEDVYKRQTVGSAEISRPTSTFCTLPPERRLTGVLTLGVDTCSWSTIFSACLLYTSWYSSFLRFR